MNGTDLPKVIYWDACVYLAWLLGQDQEYGADSIDAIRQAAKDNFDTKLLIVTSTITFVEVLSSHLDDAQERQFRKCFRNQHHVTRDVDPPIAMKARDFRQAVLRQSGGKKLATPDAIHLATASIYGVGECWTFDPHLLRLSGDEDAGALKICKPWMAQRTLFRP